MTKFTLLTVNQMDMRVVERAIVADMQRNNSLHIIENLRKYLGQCRINRTDNPVQIIFGTDQSR